MIQTNKLLWAASVALLAGATSYAGTLSGTVSGGHGATAVYIDTIAGKTFPAAAKSISIDQKSLVFRPHLTVVQQGTTVDFVNSDTVAHNIFWPGISGNKKLSHNLGTWPQGEKRSFKFDSPGVVPLLCNVHPEMSAFVIVSPTPYFVEADASGTYRIENVPDGAYKVVAWREGAKPVSKPVTVAGNTTADFAVVK
jgi:plastocyanin